MKNKRERYPELLFLPFLLALTFVLYAGAFRVFFSLDDLQFLSRAAGLEHAGGLRRVISTQWFFDASWRLFGVRAWAYHLIVLLLHAANASIVYLLARRLGLKKAAAYSASILFAAAYVAFLPLHWISGIQEVSVTFFALISAYFFLGRTAAAAGLSLAAACLSILCKETSLFLLPALALVLPASARRKWILGSAGLLFGATILVLSGSLAPRPAGNPYESAFGANILWNLLTYTAWLFRFWDYFPDRSPRYDAALAGWGLVVPALVCLAAWRAPRARKAIGAAIVVFILLVAPVLPLVRHSYLYYLYLPLIPFWLLAGAYVGNLSRRRVSTLILAAFVLLSFVNGTRHRRARIMEGVPEDPILRYAAVARNAVDSFRTEGEIARGDYLILKPLSATTIDLDRGPRGARASERERFTLVEAALLGGKALRLFFPAMQRICFEDRSGPVPGWQNMHLYLTYGPGMMKSLGYGETGRMFFTTKCIEKGMDEQAKRELVIMLELHPDDPALIGMLGETARRLGDAETLQAAVERLRKIAVAEGPSGAARAELARLAPTR
ncbi:MAG: glycosyltransferase family 39 protein [Candidatus Krumholzibacteriaceae bacterium]|jgi:hypothetical protein